MKYFIFLITFALIAGCKSVRTPEDATTVPPDRLWGFTKKSDAQLIVLGGTSLGGDCIIRISIDGKPAADFSAADVARFGLTFGSHTLSVRTTLGCSIPWAQEIKLSVKSGDAMIIRINEAGLILPELISYK